MPVPRSSIVTTLYGTRDASTNYLQNKLLSTDTQPAFDVKGDGKIEWGPGGTSAVDSNFYRAGVGVLKTDGNLIVAGTITASSTFTASSNLAVTGNATVGGTLGVTGATTVGGTLGVTGVLSTTTNATVGGTLGVTGLITATAGLTANAAITANQGLVLADAKDVTIDVTTGSKIGQSGSKIGFYGTTPIVRPSAYTQTYSTATKTHANVTAAVPPAGGTGATAGAYDTAAHRDSLITSVTNLITDVTNVKQVLNQVIDDLQAEGLLQ